MAVARFYDYDQGEWVLLAAGRDGTPGASSWGDLTGRPSVYPPESHTHPQSEVDGLGTALAGKASADHSHPEYATTDQVNARTPEIRIVSSPDLATTPGVLYAVREG